MKLSVLMPVGGKVRTDSARRRACDWLVKRYRQLLPDSELVFGYSDEEPYNRSQARNDAFAACTGDVLLVADADTVFNQPQIRTALQLIEDGAPWVIPYERDRYYNLTEQATDRTLDVLAPSSHVPEPEQETEWAHKITSWAGLIVVTRAAWHKVGGYDEQFRFWGYDDNAFRFALDRLVGPHVRCQGAHGYAVHLWHDAPEEDCFGNPEIQQNQARCRRYEMGLLP